MNELIRKVLNRAAKETQLPEVQKQNLLIRILTAFLESRKDIKNEDS